eukprot:jgi/Undpi1/2383/HiC_scaffold_13.g05764.m1
MPRHEEEEEHKGGGAGRHGKGHADEEGHGKPGREHGEGREGGRGKHGGGGHGRHGGGGDSDDSGGDDDDDEDEEDESGEAKEEEAKHPGWIKAGRKASRKWKRQHGLDAKTHMKDLTPEQRKEVRVAKRTARRHFVAAKEKA